ncbi:DNA-directed DNA polymerase [Tanacetum coccineum]|uniref:DNA-directed DNA polymerase n=1 Tax=Tanacetum coccineum TaxID=301880 RepID=A0ABQ5BS46_9ASTR
MSDIKGISPSYCTHKILMEDDYKPVIQPQRHLNSKVQDVVKNDIMKLLDSRLIYPISDSSWVSPIHVVPKKGGMIVVLNDNYRFFQIPIALEDQEKTTFTCPYGTFAYRQMPFGLCNALATFQRSMTAIFYDMMAVAAKTQTIDYQSRFLHLEKLTGPTIYFYDTDLMLRRSLENYKAYDMIQELKTMFEKQAKQELFKTVNAFYTCKQEEGKAIAELHAMLKLHEKGIPKKAKTPAMLAIREGKIQKNKKKLRGAKGKDKDIICIGL